MKSHVILLGMLWCEISIFMFFLAGLILGSVGLSEYIKNYKDELTYRPWQTNCLVKNYTWEQCQCHSSGDYCPVLVPCFNENYLVTYEIFNQTRITSLIQIKMQSTRKRIQIGDSQVCYYNGKNNVTSVKWTYANKTVGFILFAIGYGISAIIFPLLIFILIILTLENRRQRQQKQIYHNIRHISNKSFLLNKIVH